LDYELRSNPTYGSTVLPDNGFPLQVIRRCGATLVLLVARNSQLFFLFERDKLGVFDKMNKIAIITGAGTGIGKYSALGLVKAGYQVVLAGRRQEKLDEVRQESADPERVLALVTDVTDRQSVINLFDQTLERFGRLDLLFNNAGGGAPPVPLEELRLDQWQRVVDVNLTGSFLCLQQAFRIMKKQNPMGGRIVNNGSISAQVPRPNSAPYTATKHAITGLTKSASLDGRQYNIVCGQIDIGNALTPMTARMQDGALQADGSIAPEPTMDVENVAQALLYMDSLGLDANVQFITVMASKMPFIGRG
jgi:NAD(P)-dependent dehydrogenase (short-subunit alcohol dehydrogenase family)